MQYPVSNKATKYVNEPKKKSPLGDKVTLFCLIKRISSFNTFKSSLLVSLQWSELHYLLPFPHAIHTLP